MTKFIEVITTIDSKEEADKLANEILKQKLGACCQISTVDSSYWWKGNIETAKEYKISIKTIESRYVELENLIFNLHSYETPQIISVPILGGSRDYLEWLSHEID